MSAKHQDTQKHPKQPATAKLKTARATVHSEPRPQSIREQDEAARHAEKPAQKDEDALPDRTVHKTARWTINATTSSNTTPAAPPTVPTTGRNSVSTAAIPMPATSTKKLGPRMRLLTRPTVTTNNSTCSRFAHWDRWPTSSCEYVLLPTDFALRFRMA